MNDDKELTAIAALLRALEPLSEVQRARVMDYVRERLVGTPCRWPVVYAPFSYTIPNSTAEGLPPFTITSWDGES